MTDKENAPVVILKLGWPFDVVGTELELDVQSKGMHIQSSPLIHKVRRHD
jgi:hypothetical protein